jgi:hypothetical protein
MDAPLSFVRTVTEPVGSARFAQIMTIAGANPSDRFSATREVDRRCPKAN